MVRTAGIRCPVAAPLDLIASACGRFDGFWQFGLKSWDMAAGAMLIKEASRLCNADGSKDYLDSRKMVTCTFKIMHALMQINNKHSNSGIRPMSR